MAVYRDTAEFMALRLPNSSLEYLQEVDERIGRCGLLEFTSQFSYKEHKWTNWTERTLGKLRPKRRQR